MVNKLKICRNCLHYVKRSEPRCPFCGGDSNSPSEIYKILGYGSIGAFVKIEHILESLITKRAFAPYRRREG